MIFQLYPISTRKHASDSLDGRRTAGTLDGLPGWNRDGAAPPTSRGLTGSARFSEGQRFRSPNPQLAALLEGARLPQEGLLMTAESHHTHRRNSIQSFGLDMIICEPPCAFRSSKGRRS